MYLRGLYAEMSFSGPLFRVFMTITEVSKISVGGEFTEQWSILSLTMIAVPPPAERSRSLRYVM